VLLISSESDAVGVERAGDATSLSTATELSYAPLELMRHGNAASACVSSFGGAVHCAHSATAHVILVLQPHMQLTCGAVLLSLSHSTGQMQIRRSRFFSQKLENGTALLSGSGTHMHQPTVEKSTAGREVLLGAKACTLSREGEARYTRLAAGYVATPDTALFVSR
jgi:hypothetical protein